MLREHETILWMDSTIRFRSPNMDSIRQQMLTSSSDIMLLDGTGHSIFAATHPAMYRYLPISRASAVKVYMRGSPTYIHGSQRVSKPHF